MKDPRAKKRLPAKNAPAWRRIQNLLLILLPILILLSLLFPVFRGMLQKRTSAPAQEADTTPPSITLTREKGYFVHPGEIYEEEGYAAYDDRDGDLTKKVEVSVNGNTVRYRVRDEAGNITVRFRQIPRLDTSYSP